LQHNYPVFFVLFIKLKNPTSLAGNYNFAACIELNKKNFVLFKENFSRIGLITNVSKI